MGGMNNMMKGEIGQQTITLTEKKKQLKNAHWTLVH